MNNIYGNRPVSGENFYGRKDTVKLLTGILKSGNSFLLLGLRRIGKSSTISEVLRIINEDNSDIEIIRLNCQTYKNLQDFYKELNLALPSTWQKKLRDALKESKKFPSKIIDFITDHVEEVDLPYIGSIKLRNDIISYSNPLKEEITKFFKDQKKHIILFIDELPFLFENINKSDHDGKLLEIESILTTLRDWREIGISQAICGSLNLHLQLQNIGISKKLLAGLTTQQLTVYSQKDAEGLINELAKCDKVDLNESQIAEMIKIIPDPIPQFLQYYFFIVKTYSEESDLQVLYDNYVQPNIVRDFEYQFEERMSHFNFEEMLIVKEILNLIKKKKNVPQSIILKSCKNSETYQLLLRLTEFEFLNMDHNQEYTFALNLIRNWWIKKNL